jgi:hypothetical protein
LLTRLKEDAIAEKKRLAPYYIGGFTHGANSSDTQGVHSEELAPYLNGVSKTEELTNEVTPAEVPKETEIAETIQEPKEAEAADVQETGGAVQEPEAPREPEAPVPESTQEPEQIAEATQIPGAFEVAKEPEMNEGTKATNGDVTAEVKNGLEILGLPKDYQNDTGSSIGIFKEH